MVFLIGVLAFGEPFSKGMLVGFLIIWAAVALFLGEMLLFARGAATKLVKPPTGSDA